MFSTQKKYNKKCVEMGAYDVTIREKLAEVLRLIKNTSNCSNLFEVLTLVAERAFLEEEIDRLPLYSICLQMNGIYCGVIPRDEKDEEEYPPDETDILYYQYRSYGQSREEFLAPFEFSNYRWKVVLPRVNEKDGW